MQAARGYCVSTRVAVSTLAVLPPAGEYCGVLRTDWREPLRHGRGGGLPGVTGSAGTHRSRRPERGALGEGLKGGHVRT